MEDSQPMTKSILRKTLVTTAATQQSPNQATSSSWFSRIQNRLSATKQDDQLHLQRQDLKRVTFSMGHLTTEHLFEDGTDDVRDILPTSSTIKQVDDPLQFLPHCYERACRLREEKEWPFFMDILQTHSFSPLTTIDLSHHPISRSLVGPIADILLLDFGLHTVRLSNCNLDDDSIGVILNSILMTDHVTELDLSQNPFKTKGYKFISIYVVESRAIRTLDISKCSPDRRATQYLSHALLYTTSLQHINMDQCALKSAHLEALAPGICRSPSLTSLSLKYNRLSSNAAHWLASLILNEQQHMEMYWEEEALTKEHVRGLERLDLAGNHFQDTAAIGPLCQALYSNRSLRHLSLANCQIYPNGCEMIADALYTNQQLISLDLSGNPIMHGSDEGIHALKTALLRNDTLQELKLINTDLDATAAITFAEVLPMNTTLTRLDLSENPSISLAGVLALSISIKMNDTLTFLDISIPSNDQELSDLQNDIAAVCTTNMIRRIEQQQQKEEYQKKTQIKPSHSQENNSSLSFASSPTSSSSSVTSSLASHTPTDDTEQSVQQSHQQHPSIKILPNSNNDSSLYHSSTGNSITSTPSEQTFPLDEISLLDDM